MAHILLAEDDNAMRSFLSTALEKAGYRVTACPDGLSALAALEAGGVFDLLLTDIVMPGMDGVELARKAVKIRPAIKTMFITGFAAVTVEEGKTKIENATVLSKPFHLADLVTQVGRMLKNV